ncbi:MAG: class I SAM-dependent methyltransferase family protein [Algisphaera sp.]
MNRNEACGPRWYDAPYNATLSTGLRTVGRLSHGVQIGLRHGFDSGLALDHVYRNRAQGITPLGRLLDRVILNTAGWRAIRHRGATLNHLLNQAATNAIARDGQARVLDLASGPGRHTLDLLKRRRHAPIQALLFDRSSHDLKAAEEHALHTHLGNRVSLTQGDAFNPENIHAAAASWQPNVVIVSGLYELTHDAQAIHHSLAALSHVVAPKATLIYTNQLTHPQARLIAHVIPRTNGVPRALVHRPQATLDAWIKQHGFATQHTQADPWGIFTVTQACYDANNMTPTAATRQT